MYCWFYDGAWNKNSLIWIKIVVRGNSYSYEDLPNRIFPKPTGIAPWCGTLLSVTTPSSVPHLFSGEQKVQTGAIYMQVLHHFIFAKDGWKWGEVLVRYSKINPMYFLFQKLLIKSLKLTIENRYDFVWCGHAVASERPWCWHAVTWGVVTLYYNQYSKCEMIVWCLL